MVDESSAANAVSSAGGVSASAVAAGRLATKAGHGVAGIEVECNSAKCTDYLLQLLYELSASRVFTLKGARGVESIRCDHLVRPLLDQRSGQKQQQRQQPNR